MRPMFACALVTFALAIPANAAPDPKKPGPIDDSAQIAEKLLDRMDIDEPIEKIRLRDVLELLTKRSGLTILIDYKAFAGRHPDQEATPAQFADATISLSSMKNVRIETVLRAVADQLDADFLIAPDHVRITTHQMKDLITGQARRLPDLYPTVGGDEAPEVERKDIVRTAGHVTVAFRDVPAADALKEIAARAGRTVVVSAPAADKAKIAVTLNLSNVPFETAAAGLAEAAGLRAFRTGNIVVIVTQERAKAAEGAAVNLISGFGGNLGGVGVSQDELSVLSRTLAKNAEADAQRIRLEEQVKKLTAELEALKKK